MYLLITSQHIIGAVAGLVLGWPAMQVALSLRSILSTPVPGSSSKGVLMVAAIVNGTIGAAIVWGIHRWVDEPGHMPAWIVAGVLGLIALLNGPGREDHP